MYNDATVDMSALISDCRNLGNQRFRDADYARAEEAFALGLSMFEMFGNEESLSAGTGCLLGLADCLRAQSRDEEAEALIKSARKRLH